MTRADLVAGARHMWALDKVGVLTVLAFSVVYVAGLVIAGAPWPLSVVMLTVAACAVAFKVYQRAKDHREALMFMDWYNDNAQ